MLLLDLWEIGCSRLSGTWAPHVGKGGKLRSQSASRIELGPPSENGQGPSSHARTHTARNGEAHQTPFHESTINHIVHTTVRAAQESRYCGRGGMIMLIMACSFCAISLRALLLVHYWGLDLHRTA